MYSTVRQPRVRLTIPAVPTEPTPQGIEAARAAIPREFRDTPLFASGPLGAAAGCRVSVKVECVNPIRSFKARGACWFGARRGPEAVERLRGRAPGTPGWVTGSAGNFGQGTRLGRPAIWNSAHGVFVPPREPGQGKGHAQPRRRGPARRRGLRRGEGSGPRLRRGDRRRARGGRARTRDHGRRRHDCARVPGGRDPRRHPPWFRSETGRSSGGWDSGCGTPLPK